MIAIALGALAGLGQAPQGWWLLTLCAVAFWLSRPALTGRGAFLHGWLFGLGYFAVSLRWIVSPFLVDPSETGWMAPFGLAFMAAGAALFWGVSRWIAFRIAPTSFVVTALMIIIAEVSRSYILTGFPWALLGHVWIDTPLSQLAAYGGPHLLTVVTLALAICLVWIAQKRWVALVGPVFAALCWIGLTVGPAPINGGPIVRLIQPNAKQSEKWDPERAQVFFNLMIDFTGQGDVPDLIVWPETAISYLLEYATPELDLVAEAARGAPTVLGINRSEGLRFYNALLVLEQGGIVSSVYDKAHIVPFGEYFPGGELLRQFGIDSFAASTGGAFTAGSAPRNVTIPGIGSARPLICYEGIFAEEIGTAERPRLMILITNDAWFGPSAGPKQHLAQARLRAIEQGLPMVRVANTGISAIIDARGRVIAQIGMNEANYLDAPLPLARAATTYSKRGDWPILFVILSTLLGCAVRSRRIWN